MVGRGQPGLPRARQGTILAHRSRVAGASRQNLGAWVRFSLAPEIIGLWGLQKPHFSGKIAGRAGGLLGSDGLQYTVIVTVPAVVRIVGWGQDVQEGGWPVYSINLVQVVPVWREHAGPAVLGVLGSGAQHARPHGLPLPGLQRRLELLLRRWRPWPRTRVHLVHAADAYLAVEHLEHAVHARVVVQRDARAALEQEDAQAEAVGLVDVHVSDRREVARQWLRQRLPRSDVEVLGAHLGQQALQLVQVLGEARRRSFGAPGAAAEGETRLASDALDQGGHVVTGHAWRFLRGSRPARSASAPPLAVPGGRHGCPQPRARRGGPATTGRRGARGRFAPPRR